MRQVLVVVDEFYDDFASVRRRALDAEYEDTARGNYGGRNSREPFVTDEVTRKLAGITGAPFAWLDGSGSGCFRETRAGERGTFDIHVDRAQLSAIVFLNDADQARGRIGTSFFRHTRTGLTGFPETADAETYKRLSDDILIPDSTVRDRWETMLDVQMVPNRLIVFPSKLFHAPHEPFGADRASARLIQMFFLVRARRP